MSLSINYSKYKFNLFYLSFPPFLLPYLLMRAFVCQPVSRDRGAGAGWLTIRKLFLILIDCAVRHDRPAVFLILQLPGDRSGSLSGVSAWCLFCRPVFPWSGATRLKDIVLIG